MLANRSVECLENRPHMSLESDHVLYCFLTCNAFLVQEVQRLAGSREVSEKMGRAVHSAVIAPGASAFLKQQCLIYLSTLCGPI